MAKNHEINTYSFDKLSSKRYVMDVNCQVQWVLFVIKYNIRTIISTSAIFIKFSITALSIYNVYDYYL